MTATEHPTESTRPLPVIPAASLPSNAWTPMYGPEFAAAPESTYRTLRTRGPIAPVQLAEGVPAMLVTDYGIALQILRAPHVFIKDSRPWQRTVAPDCPVLPMMSWRPNTLFADGPAHARLRAPVTESLRGIDSADLRDYVRRSALGLIAEFAGLGRADLLTDFTGPLPLLVLQQMFGCPPEISDRMVGAIAALWNGDNAEEANAELERTVRDLVTLKRDQPGEDVTSRLLAHPNLLTDDEMLHQLVVMIGAGVEPVGNWVANALLLLLTEDRFASKLANGSVTIDEALDEVLWRFPPLANYAITYPVRSVRVGGVLLPAGQPVVISIAATNTDPSVHLAEVPSGNRAHLAFGAGAHGCPARQPARLIATVALETILDQLPDLRLAPGITLSWRPGPFHRALTALPVRFPRVRSIHGVPTDPEGREH